MAKKTCQIFGAVALSVLLSMGCVILENTVKSQGAESIIEKKPEKGDLYNQYGLPVGEKLSDQKIWENESLVFYADRILNFQQFEEDCADNIFERVQELKNRCSQNGDVSCEFYLMPVPTRAMWEEGYEQETAKFEKLLEDIRLLMKEDAKVIDVLPELKKHSDEYLYFRTEDCWTMRGAFYGMQEVRRTLGEQEEQLENYWEYMYGHFLGSLKADVVTKIPEYSETIKNMERDLFYIYMKPDNPNREEVTMENDDGALEKVKRHTICMGGSGLATVIGNAYLHSIVSGSGKDGILLIADSKGKLLAPYLAELYETVYVVNIYRDINFVDEMNEILTKYGIRQIVWAQNAAEMGDSSYTKVLNQFVMRKDGR